MINSIHIKGYRGFDQFDMAGLGRLNLLVGTNNSGKTSVLEALYLLNSRGDPMSLWNLLWRRGERLVRERNPRHPEPELDICHLFNGHELHIGSKFSLSAKNETPERTLSFTISDSSELSAKERAETLGPAEQLVPSRLVLQIRGNSGLSFSLPLSRSFGLSSDVLDSSPRARTPRRRALEEDSSSQFITTDSINSDELIAMWNKVQLTPQEDLVLRALRFLDPQIERIASQSVSPQYYIGAGSRGGFVIRQKGYEQPIPIGSMGDGMWRMLAMAIAITQCRGGALLVDEIDTGLHYTVMTDMWRLIYGAAREFNVQVFATTHSYDCVQSLAHVCTTGDLYTDQVTLHRIELGRKQSVPYSEEELKMVADRNIEVR
jgi:hypothetical protein